MEAEHELLHQRVAVVTGGAGGIGQEICRLLATAGIRVVLTARRQEQAERAVTQIEAVSDQLLIPAALFKLSAVDCSACGRVFAGIERFRKLAFLGDIAHHQVVDGA